MGEMSEIDIVVRNYIDEYKKSDYVSRATQKKYAAIQSYTWQEVFKAIERIDSGEEEKKNDT